MAFKHFVTCVTRSDMSRSAESIWLIGGYAWRHSVEDAIQYIEKGIYEYYIRKGNRLIAIMIGNNNGQKYLWADDGRNRPDPLQDLPECD